MLNNGTKRHIDNARDILVGKVPDPKAQVEQITNALIHKFMSDMDQQSILMGGKAGFFVGEYEQYAWQKILDVRLSGQARMDLYIRALENMWRNPELPPLFSEILNGAYLPYRDPKTLTLFLKEIDEFKYEHSEDLGDAYEYLLSVLGSQGAAGQFRTPRHIIDFMVAVVDPQKNERILDPACGTAGFLISAYNHILKRNEEKGLTPSEKEWLMNNIVGYDISPDMVKLSRVNMYLHQFQNPKIQEYDTLTSEERWDDEFDVIMANPPFMTPRGGIIPHQRFMIQANRSEVLFVDYIVEHLSGTGRAAIIVPEGIIFKNENAYKQLRKMLVEDGLYAVVSLPSGVFNPYSGVKTSILFFDNQIAKNVDEMLFIKIKNDGFDLGAQRHKIDENDLPMALEVLNDWKKGEKRKNDLVLWVKKSKVSENDEYNLTGESYQKADYFVNTQWPCEKLGEVTEIISGQSPDGQYYNEKGEGIPFYQGKKRFGEIYLQKPIRWTTDVTKIAKEGDILMSVRAPVGPVNISTHEICIGRGLAAIRPTKIDRMYLFYMLRAMQESIKGGGGTVFNSISRTQISGITIPFPPLEVQQDIVAQIEVKQAVIDGAKQVIANLEKERRYFGRELQKMDDVEWVEIGKLCDLMTGGTPTSTEKKYYENGKINWIVSGDIHKGEIFDCDGRITKLGLENSNARILPINSVLIALNGQGKTRGTVALLRTEAACNQSIVSINPRDKKVLLPEYLLIVLRSMYHDLRKLTGDRSRRGLNMTIIRRIQIPVVSLEQQKLFISDFEKQNEIIYSNKQVIKLMEEKIEEVIEAI